MFADTSTSGRHNRVRARAVPEVRVPVRAGLHGARQRDARQVHAGPQGRGVDRGPARAAALLPHRHRGHHHVQLQHSQVRQHHNHIMYISSLSIYCPGTGCCTPCCSTWTTPSRPAPTIPRPGHHWRPVYTHGNKQQSPSPTSLSRL